MNEEVKDDEKKGISQPLKEIPPPYYPPPPPGFGSPPMPRFEVMDPETRIKLTTLKIISFITVTICVISLIAFISGVIYFNSGLNEMSGMYASIDVVRGILLMVFSIAILFGIYIFVLGGLKKTEV